MYQGFKGEAKRLEDIDLPRIGHEIGVGEDVIHAIIDVEAPKCGFDDDGRPRILFEPHVFYRELGPGSNRELAIRSGLAYPNWRAGAYGKESEQYEKLERALKIDRLAAIMSASWGRSQIMGFNHKLAGYSTPEAMVHEFCDDEDNHIEAMVSFIVSVGIDDELRAIQKLGRATTPNDWRPVALAYNGKGYATHNYHGRLSDRFNWWRLRPDTPWSPHTPVAIAAPPAAAPAPPPPPEPPVHHTPPAPTSARALSFWERLFGRT